MKKMILAAVALFALLPALAQEIRHFDFNRRDTTRIEWLQLPDSVLHTSPRRLEYKTMNPVKIKPYVSMSSVVVVQPQNLPARVTLLLNNSLRLERRFNLSTGHSWNWGPLPDAHLDARTLSFPMRR